ncbi:MAG: class I tRNA ligase family protein [Candidatus Zambryskibacteria bacterium]|nr:class I tRNA ligase family protein [Candidatus Zambryskibacteria bacterium]
MNEKEQKILQFWEENKIFEKSLEKPAPKGEFVFYDGPPFATGLPHAGSLLSSVIKDVIPRYKTMRGYHVCRRWGWDCHGLPIENMIEKELGIKDKTEIENKIGVKAFNEACRASVLRYAEEWKKYIERVGRWVEYDNAYKTMDNSYIESVWHALKNIHQKGLLYEGRKVLLYCPHCQTPIAKAEVAMDNSYKDITEEAVYVKFKICGANKRFLQVLGKNPQTMKKSFVGSFTYFLAWTTTPWTLPGNVALAVGKNISYTALRLKDVPELLIVASSLVSKIFEDQEIEIIHDHIKGKDLTGLEYEPLYEIPAVRDTGKKAWYVAEGDFVTTEEGTGVVHTAVLYGEDDYDLGVALDLPMVELLDAGAHFNEKAPELIRGQYFKKAEKTIKEDLGKKNLIFKLEKHTHSYPHCHRCGTALLYNAVSSWFINIQKVKDRMIELNERINWVPEHLKHGRFLNIVENAPDWTISRNRYWASPLPIWRKTQTDADKYIIVGSLDDLKKYTKKSGNKFIFVRHGEAENNTANVVNCDQTKIFHLTEKGKNEAQNAAKKIERADVIFASPYMRVKETAEIIAKALNFDLNKIQEDERLAELNFGELNGKLFTEYLSYEEKYITAYDTPLPSGESYNDAKLRFGQFIYEIDKKYQGKTIVVVTHGIGMETAAALLEGADQKRSKEIIDTYTPLPGEVLEFNFIPLPHNDNYELDLHRPYIDEIELVSEDGMSLKRIPEVLDGWVESASMPFAEYHYPFENKKKFESRFPGDFVAEYIAQTRTWFYYMHTVAVVLFDNVAFKNVVSTGNVLAGDGSKMSKSKGNYTDPLVLLERMGADAFRYYLMSSVVMRSEDMLFKDEEVKEVQNRLVNMLSNSFAFYELYADGTDARTDSTHVLDRWIISRLHALIKEVTEAMENYDMVQATRPLKDFVSDLSTWYIRRSRDRLKGERGENKTNALATSRYVFKEFSKLIAPVMPFIAEEIYQKVRNNDNPMSVHLCDWPFDVVHGKSEGEETDDTIIALMRKARKIASLALELRQKAGIKVRQPLGQLKVKSLKLKVELLELIKDEINVKEIVADENIVQEVELDTILTPELIEEGKLRDAIRAVQDWRKEKSLKPGEKVKYDISQENREFFVKHADEIKRVTNVKF